MDKHKPILFIFSSFLLLSSNPSLIGHGQLLPIIDDQIQTYIVHVRRPEGTELLGDADRENWHRSFLPNTTLSSGLPRLVYSYRNVISGFAARLTPKEVMAMESMDGFVAAQPDQRHQVQTTHTPDFLGLRALDGGVWFPTLYGEGVIIGVLDTGIYPIHPSFRDKEMPPPPIKWNGTCDFTSSSCNNKLIGATAFYYGNRTSPEDEDGHGCHVASIAAGNFVNNARVLGTAKGTAAGMAPKAHLAMYRVCFLDGCGASDELMAIDQAISDNVDVLSMSIDAQGKELYTDYIIIGSFAAVENGIVPVVIAGNKGPAESSLVHDAPWALVVGASTTDRRIRATVKLGDENGTELHGETAYQPAGFSNTMLEIAYPAMYSTDALYCEKGKLDYMDVRGKIVLCWSGSTTNIEKGQVVFDAGGAAMIVMNLEEEQYTTNSDPHVLPVAHVSYIDGDKIRSYVYSNSTTTASINFNGTVLGVGPAPAVASFSSRGPSKMNGGILKPDVIAPGVNILAAWPSSVGPNPNPFAKKTFNFKSGTSQAAPHVSGVVALLKSKHPDWSPAKIQSAIITTAKAVDLDGNPITDEAEFKGNASFFAMGAGHLNPAGALDPGLVYDIQTDDYIGYLCGLGYEYWQVFTIVRRDVNCSSITAIDAAQLNYPSISVSLGSSASTVTVRRTVTNVGEPESVYWASIDEPEGVKVDLSFYKLGFKRLNQEMSFNITFTLKEDSPSKKYSEGQLSWVDGKHVVRSPITVAFT